MDVPRRTLLLGAAGTALARPVIAATGPAAEQTAWDFSFQDIDGGKLDLGAYRGRVLMVVNTASFCGFTYQYEALEALHKRLNGQGLTVIGVPTQDFDQESDSNAQVKKFCEVSYGIDFPLAGLSHVKGAQAHPFYRWVKARKNWEPAWNFGKVVIGRNGQPVACYGSSDEPSGPRITATLDAALKMAAA